MGMAAYLFSDSLTDYFKPTDAPSVFTQIGINGETERILQQNVSTMYDDILDEEEASRYEEQLTDVLLTFEQYGTGSAEEFSHTILSTMDSLKDLMTAYLVVKYTNDFFRMANLEFNNQHPVNFADEIINNWLAGNLSFQQRLNWSVASIMEETHIDETVYVADILQIKTYGQVREMLLADINRIRLDSLMSPGEYEALVSRSLQAFSQMELKTDDGENISMLLLIPKTYYEIAKLFGADVESLLTIWFYQNSSKDFDQLQNEALAYIKTMEEGMHLISETERKTLEVKIIQDIKSFIRSSDQELLTQTALSSLKSIEQIAGDTEDREYFAALYCNLAHLKGFSIGKEVNKWMYGAYAESGVYAALNNRPPWELM
jgi:hypothetical protein